METAAATGAVEDLSILPPAVSAVREGPKLSTTLVTRRRLKDDATFRLERCPNEMTIDRKSGLVTWETAIAETHTVVARIMQKKSGLAEVEFHVEVEDIELNSRTRWKIRRWMKRRSSRCHSADC